MGNGGVSLGFGFNVSTGVIIAIAVATAVGALIGHSSGKNYHNKTCGSGMMNYGGGGGQRFSGY